VLLDLAQHKPYGVARAMIVDSLWRYRKDDRVARLLTTLVDDPSVALAAMTALRRTVGSGNALPHLRRVRDNHPDAQVRQHATRQVKRAEKSAAP
jgi:hypothetical protein